MNPTRDLLTAALAVGLLSVLPSCAAIQQPTSALATETTPAAQRHAQTMERQADRAFSDAQIVAVISAVNMAEIEPSQLALERSQNPEVRAFARQMVNEHAAAEQRLQQVAGERRIRTHANQLSYQLDLNRQAALTELQQLQGAEFDRAYVLHQIGTHQFALHSLDTNLIQSTHDPVMRQFLTNEFRPTIQRHYNEIQAIHSRMMAPAPAGT